MGATTLFRSIAAQNKIETVDLVGNLVALCRLDALFIGREWRVFLLEGFGMKHNGHIGIYPTCKVWAPWNVEMDSWGAIDDSVNLYSADKIKIGTKVAISREAFICTASHDIRNQLDRL